MRRILACLLAMLMLVGGIAAQAEESAELPAASQETAEGESALPEVVREKNYHELKVGTTTPMDGNFFTDMWGSNATDMDVRYLLHGYNLMEWQSGTGAYAADASVVMALVGTEDAEGNRTYNVAIYDDLYYSDGMPVTARDYAFSMLLALSPQVAEIGGQLNGSEYLLGAADYKSGASATLAGVRLVNDTQFTVTVSADYLPFFYELALLNYNPYPIHVIAPGCIVDDDGEGVYIRNMTEEELAAQQTQIAAGRERVAEALRAENERRAEGGEEPFPSTLEEILPPEEAEEAAVEEAEAGAEDADAQPIAVDEPLAEGDDAPRFTADLLRETILDADAGYLSHPSVVSGPYRELSYDAGAREASFERNLMYKGNSQGGTPTVERVIVKSVTAENEIAALASGEVDLLNRTVNADVLAQGVALTAQSDELSTANYTRSGYSFISFSCERPTVSSQAVRQAIAHCLDRDALVADYVGNYGLAVDGYYGMGQWMYQMVQGQIQAQPAEGEAAEGEADAGEAAEGEADAGEAAEGENAGEEPAEEIELSMDGIKTYPLDVSAAVALLEGDGWTLNRAGEPFDPAKDDVRCKEIADGEYQPLELKLIYPEGNDIGAALQANFVDHLAEAGILLTVEPVPMSRLLSVYYRSEPRDVDMIYLATNFSEVFDPSSTFNPADAAQGAANRTGIADEELYELAVDMRRTEPGQVMEYCQKWVKFQERFSEVLPTIPIYSNVYFDFYTSLLQNYLVGANMSWSQALVDAYLSDAPQPEEAAADEAGATEETGEGEIIIE